MKKFLSVLLALTTVVGSTTAVSLSASADNAAVNSVELKSLKTGDTFTSGALKYTVLSNGTLEVTGIATYKATKITVPSKVKGKTVTAIGSFGGLGYSSYVTSIVLPSTIKTIGSYAFSGNTKLKSIKIPSSVTSIGDCAFNGCKSLTAAPIIPKGVTTIGDAPFSGCTGITAIRIDNKNKNYIVRSGVLYNKAQTKLIQYPNGKKGAFTVPAKVTNISSSAFSKSTKLTSVNIPKGIYSLSTYTFSGCTSLAAVNVDKNNYYYSSVGGVVYSKDKKTLRICPAGKKGAFKIPTGVTEIGSSAFSNCTKLTSITVPNSVKTIGGWAFEKTSISKITVPASVNELSVHAFDHCAKLSSIAVNKNNKTYSSIGGVVFNNNKTTLVLFPCGKSGNYTVPNGVKTIGTYAFYDCDKVKSVKLSGTVTKISKNAFEMCSNMNYINLNKNIKTIENQAFWGMYNLYDIYYAGTRAAWKKVKIGSDNSTIDRAYIHCSNDAKMTNLKKASTKNSVKLSWSKNSKASHYEVYIFQNNYWKTLSVTKNNSITKYTVSNLKPNTTVRLRVAAYNGKKVIAMSDFFMTTKK